MRLRLFTAVVGLTSLLAVHAAAAQDGTEAAAPVVAPVAPAAVPAPAPITVFTADARRAIAATGGDEKLSVIVRLDDQVDLAEVLRDHGDDPTAVVTALQDHAATDQALFRVLGRLLQLGPDVDAFTPLWITNAFAITATPDVLVSIASLPGVAEIDIERLYLPAGTAPAGPAAANVEAIGAPAMWAQGHTGEGVVVAVLDTGVDILGLPGVFPSEVVGSYRGGTNSWFDPYNATTDPYDLDGHGTAVASIVTGRDASGTALGVAPDAQWIAAKIFDDRGVATTSAIHQAIQWALDPDGDPGTADGAQIVNASWTNAAPGCDTEFRADLDALRAAGVIPVFAAGNLGPLPGSSPSPSNLPGAVAVGAVDASETVLVESSRGPTECGGATRTYPHLVAPGDQVTAQGVLGQFQPFTGTSFAAPHVAGAAALLTGALGTPDDVAVEAALLGGARDLGPVGADDSYGAGMVDVAAAWALLSGPVAPSTGDLSGTVFHDVDRDGAFGGADLPIGAAQVTVEGPGPDASFGTADDVILGETVSAPDGSFLFSALDPGTVRVSLAPTSVPAGEATTSWSVEVTIEAGATAQLAFGWHPPAPGALEVAAFTDLDADAIRSDAEPPLAGVAVTVAAAGLDGVWGSADDPETRTIVTDETGVARLDALVPGPVRLTVDSASLPERGFVTSLSDPEPTIVSAQTTVVTLGVHVPDARAPRILVSSNRAGRANQGTLSFRDEDILAWNGASLDVFFDGSDVGLSGADVDAFHLLDPSTLLLSFDRPVDLDGVGRVDDNDIVRFTATQLGASTRGSFSIEVDGDALGLTGRAGDIDAISATRDGDLLVSIRGNVEIEGLGVVRDEDLLRILPPAGSAAAPSVTTASTGAAPSDTTSTQTASDDTTPDDTAAAPRLEVWFDGSTQGLVARAADVDAAALGPFGLSLSTIDTVELATVRAGDGDVLACHAVDSCDWSVGILAGSIGLGGVDLDALSFPPEASS